MIPSEFSLEGKAAIVTGAAQGLGKAIALTLAETGADVIIADLSLAAAEQTAEEVRALGRKSLAIRTDVRDTEQVEKMVADTIAELGKIDILVANAGIDGPRPMLLVDGQPTTPMRAPVRLDAGLSDEEWTRILDVNLTGYARCARAVGRHMLAQKSGKIIAIGSIAAMRNAANDIHYAASKAGVHRVTQGLAEEWAGFNINVNCIAPGAFVTPIWDHPHWNITEEESRASKELLLDYMPMKRFGEPRELGLLAAFLASDAANYINGQIIAIDGGVTA